MNAVELKPTVEELLPLKEFTEAVQDLKQEEWVLIRFLRARNYDVEKAEQMIRTAIQWREEIDLKNYLNWDFPSYYKSEMAYSYYGKDFEGAPAMWISIGKWNGKVLVDNGEGENLLRWAYAMAEKGLKIFEDVKCQGVVIIDLEGLSYSQVSHLASLKLFYHGAQKIEGAFPELFKSLFIINAPWVFTMAWNFIKGCIPKHTLEKFHIYGANKNEWMPKLLERFPVDSILPELTKDMNGN